MSRGGAAVGVKSNRKSHICAECGKAFRSGEELFMHAEICLLDAFEVEASAVQGSPGEKRAASKSALSQTGQSYGGAALEEQFLANDEGRNPKRSGKLNQADESGQETENALKRSELDRGVVSEQVVVTEAVEDDLGEESDDYEPPPQLELAEPLPKKYKRVFPIGDDGKQIRPKMECPTCGLILYRHNFSTHFRIHTGELPFQCSFCDKRFRTSSALTVHTRCHTGERPYECPHCNYCCITKRNLDRHIINNHVKKSNRAAARMARGDFMYMPRSRQAVNLGLFSTGQLGNLSYGDDLEDDMYEDEIDEENIDEAELEEEAGISRMPQRQDQASFQSQVGGNSPMLAAQGTTARAGSSDQQTEGNPYEPAYKRLRAIPILDGPEGVYGDPEQERSAADQHGANVVVEKEGEVASGRKDRGASK